MKALKKIVTFYLGSWWLPPLSLLLWSVVTVVSFAFAVVFLIGSGKAPTNEPNNMGAYFMACAGIGVASLLLSVGSFFCWITSFIGLLIHKRWIRAALSFLVLPLLIYFIFFCLPSKSPPPTHEPPLPLSHSN